MNQQKILIDKILTNQKREQSCYRRYCKTSTSCKNKQKIFLRRQHSSHRISQSNIPLFFMRGHRPHCSKHILRHTVQGEPRKTGSMSQRIGSFNDTFFLLQGFPECKLLGRKFSALKNSTMRGST